MNAARESVFLLAHTLACGAVIAGQPGSIVGWGYNGSGAATGTPTAGPPTVSLDATGLVSVADQPLTNAMALAAGGSHCEAVLSDGSLVWWGAPLVPGDAGLPPSLHGHVLTNLIAIAVGRSPAQNFALGLRRDGTVLAWGDNRFGQTDVPAHLSNVLAIAAGGLQGLALKRDGTVAAWGSQANPPPAGLSNVVAISAGGESGRDLALKRDGTVFDWPVRSALYDSRVPAGLSNERVSVNDNVFSF